MSFIIRLAALLLCFMTVSGSQLSNLTERELTDVYIDSLALTIPLPEDAYVTDRTVSADYPPLEYFGMTAAQLEVELKKGNISPEELQSAKMAAFNAYKEIYDSPGAIVNWYSNRRGLGIELTPEEMADKIAATTAEDIASAARDIIPDTFYMLQGGGEDE